MSGVEYEVSNVVLTVSYGDVELDLEKIASNFGGVEYNPEVFAGLTYRMVEPEASFLIFASGNANCLGANSIDKAERAVEKLTGQLESLGFEVGEPEVRVRNMVASMDFRRRFDLERMARKLPNVEYEPEVFPGLVYRVEEGDATFLLFGQGEGVCVGAKNAEEIEKGIREITRNVG